MFMSCNSLDLVDSSSTPSVTDSMPPSESKLELNTQVDVVRGSYRIDGGFDAWSVIAGSSLAMFVQFGLATSYGTFQFYYSRHQLSALSVQKISWIGSVQLFLIFFFGSVSGWSFDAYGPRPVLVTGSTLIILSLFLVSFFQDYHEFMICQGVLFGIGSSLIYNSCISLAGQWFLKRRATAAGIVTAGAGVGGVVFPIMISRLIQKIGFAWTVRTVALMSMVILSFSIVLVKARLRRTASAITLLEPLTAMRENASYRWLVIACFFGFWGFWVPYFYISDFCKHHGFSSSESFYMLPVLNSGSAVGRLIGSIADKWGRFNVLTVALFYFSIIVLTMWTTITGHAAIYVFSALFGLGSGLFIALFPACIAQVSPPELMGSRFGFACFVFSFASLTGPPIAGGLISHGTGANAYITSGLFSGVAILAGSLCVCMARISISKDVMKVV